MKFLHRLHLSATLAAVFLISGFAGFNRETRAQNPDTLMPEASAAKAKQILGQLIDAMGGPAFVNARESQCSGRMSPIGRGNDFTPTIPITIYWRYPDKTRTDIGKKGNIVDLYAGNDGWTLDHDGVSEEPSEKVDNFRAQLPSNPLYIFRYRLQEQDMFFRWAGLDVIDLKPVDWVELTDSHKRVYRIAIDRGSHLMVRFKLTTPAEANELPDEDVTYYANYHPFDGVQTAMQIWKEHNGRRTTQAFYESCSYRPNLPADFFTRAALERRLEEVGSRTDKKKAAKGKD